ncbi:MAG: 50S ribosomal protein L11 methyltransferase [Bryobacteraceae bacterium]|nr:50S ribosomal protein L11 methyltransferase [Bryobacteraceae bacterium]MDW8378639.1 50S ribosomal protein L11 methyltransferase [Bryobacterales bacterium]
MFSVTLCVNDEELDWLVAELVDLGTVGLREEPGQLTAYFETEQAAHLCSAHFATRQPVVQQEETLDYSANWQRYWRPLCIGQRFYLSPPGDTSTTPGGRIRLPMRPGNVFGSGDHPTTQLCLELLESLVQPQDRVLDVGTGTGILAEACRQLGARLIAACDLSAEAIESLDRNTPLLRWRGTADAARTHGFSLAVANLPTGVLTDLMPELNRLLAPGGSLVASGFLEEQIPRIETALTAQGLCPETVKRRQGWGAATARKTSASGTSAEMSSSALCYPKKLPSPRFQASLQSLIALWFFAFLL